MPKLLCRTASKFLEMKLSYVEIDPTYFRYIVIAVSTVVFLIFTLLYHVITFRKSYIDSNEIEIENSKVIDFGPDNVTNQMIQAMINQTVEQRTQTNRSQEYVKNSRGQELHVRTFWPKTNSPSGIVVFLHGYAAHANRPIHLWLSKSFVGQQLAYVTVDFHSHGHSPGLKGYIKNVEYLIDDAISLLIALYSLSKESATHSLFSTASPEIPFFLIGHSMGGGISMILSDLLTHIKTRSISDTKFYGNFSFDVYKVLAKRSVDKVARQFSGCVLISPLIELLPYPTFVRRILNFLFVPFFAQISLSRGGDGRDEGNEDIWIHKTYVDYIASDGFPKNPFGLSYGGSVRIGTLATLLHVSECAKASSTTASYPYILIHDPADKIVKYTGTLHFHSTAPSSDKQLVIIRGSLHDPIANRLGLFSEMAISWIRQRINSEMRIR